MRFSSLPIWFLLTVLAAFVLPLWFGLSGNPDLAVQSTPRRTHSGRIGIEAPPGQSFLCKGAGLHRIDVALTAIGQFPAEVELVLSEKDTPETILRRTTLLPDPKRRPQFLSFDFEPLPESANRWYHFELRPTKGSLFANHAVWIRFHGNVGRNDLGGNQLLSQPSVEGTFESRFNDLRAVAFLDADLSTKRGPIQFELWEQGQSDPLRTVKLPEPTVVNAGNVFFSFAPIRKSQGRRYSYRLFSTGEFRLAGFDGSACIKSFHGLPGSRPGMGGMTLGIHEFPDRDLVFRTWTATNRLGALQTLHQRMGWRLWAAMLGFIGSIVALRRAMPKP